MPSDWEDKVVLITGASSGIGRALAVAWARKGARVALLARRAEALEEVAGAAEAAGGRAFAVVADVRKSEAVKAAVELVEREWERVDVLVANAGIGGGRTSAREFPLERATEVFETNVVGVMNSVAAALPGMLARGRGHIVGISSIAGFQGLPASGAYCASKAALSTLLESLRVELRGSGVLVTTIQPGFIRTPLTSGRARRMPFLMDVEPAAEQIVRAVERRRTTYTFPWQLALVARVANSLPNPVRERILARVRMRE